MPAELVSIQSPCVVADKPADREKRLCQESLRTQHALFDALRTAGLIIINDACTYQGPLAAVWREMERAWLRYRSCLDGRARKVERVLRNVLAVPTLDDEQRAAVVEALYGRRAKLRDGNLLTPTEARLMKAFRESDRQGRQMLLTMLDFIAAASAASEKGGVR